MSGLVLIACAWIAGSAAGGQTVRDAGHAYRLLTGFVLIAVVTLVIGSVALSWAAIVIGLGTFALALLVVARRWHRTPPDHATPLRPTDAVETIAAGITLVSLAMGLLQALAPSTSWDAAVAHLALPADFVRDGRIELLPGNAYSGYPLLAHCLYTAAYIFEDEISVQLVAWAFAAIACVTTFDLGRQLAGRRAGWIAMAIIATAPIFGEQAGVASLDVAFAGVIAGALAQWLRWYDTAARGPLLLAACLCGSACGIRHTGFLVCALVLTGTSLRAYTSTRQARPMIAAACTFIAAAALTAAPWVLRSTIVTGNPFYPFFMSFFESNRIYDTEITALGAHESIKGRGLWYFLTFPWNIVMHPERFDGWGKSPGGLVLILGLPGLILGGPKARWLGAFSLAGLVAFYHFQHLARYMLPFFVPMMAVAAVPCVTNSWKRLALPVWGLGAMVGLTVFAAMIHFKVPAALGFESREDYLTRRVERFPVFQYLNANLPESAGVLTLDPRTYYIDRPAFHNYDALKVMRDWPIDRQLAWFREHNLRYLVYPKAYLEESPGFGEKGYLTQFDTWRNDNEHFRLLHRFEIPRPRVGGTETVELYEIQPD